MDQPDFSVFRYLHDDSRSPSRQRLRFVYISLAVALIATLFVFPFAALLFIVPLIAWFSAPKTLCLGPRYLLCGGRIVYFANVVQLTLAKAEGKLSLQSANGEILVLERDKFPSNARKADKLARNKAEKFAKTSEKIIERVRKACPSVRMTSA